MSIEAMKQMTDALGKARSRIIEAGGSGWKLEAQRCTNTIEAGRQAIAEAEKQEPVAMQMDVIVVNLVREGIDKHRARELAEHFIKHTHPQPKRQCDMGVMCIECPDAQPKREWVGLTDEEKEFIEIMGGKSDRMLAEEVEAKLKEKNT